jgi:hypothetical protein
MNRSITSHCLLLGLLVLLLGGCKKGCVYQISERTADINDLRGIWQALATYAEDHHGESPENLGILIDGSSVTAKTLYVTGNPHQQKWRYIGKAPFDDSKRDILIESNKIYDGKKLVLHMDGSVNAVPVKP